MPLPVQFEVTIYAGLDLVATVPRHIDHDPSPRVGGISTHCHVLRPPSICKLVPSIELDGEPLVACFHLLDLAEGNVLFAAKEVHQVT